MDWRIHSSKPSFPLAQNTQEGPLLLRLTNTIIGIIFLSADLQRLEAYFRGSNLTMETMSAHTETGEWWEVPQYSMFEDLQVGTPCNTLEYTQQAAAPVECEGCSSAHFPYDSYLCPLRDLRLLLPGHWAKSLPILFSLSTFPRFKCRNPKCTH